MQNINNPWLGYLDRSYIQIKASCLNALKVIAPELSDFSESNPLVIILSMYSGVAEMLNYYLDNQARESFIGTARISSSIIKGVRILDYRIKARSPESVTLVFYAKNIDDTPYIAVADIIIPLGVKVIGTDGYTYTTTITKTLLAGQSSIAIGAEEFTLNSDIVIGITTNDINQAFSLGTKYQHKTISVSINGEIWVEVKSFAFSFEDDKHFIVDMDVDGLMKVIFGDNIKGRIPDSGFNVLATYQTTEAFDRKVKENTLTSIISSMPAGPNKWTVNNPEGSSGGMYYEDKERIRRNAPLFARTLEKATTFTDFDDIALQIPGVQFSNVKACCSRDISIYIAPTDSSGAGGIASDALLNSVEEYFMDNRILLGRTITPSPSGVTHVKIGISGKANFGITVEQANLVAKAKLTEEFGYNNSKVNRKIRLSDIYGVLKSLKELDYINIDFIKTEPYARPTNTVSPLVWTREVITSTTEINWKIQKTSTLNAFSLFKGSSFIGSFLLGDLVDTARFSTILGIISFTITSGSYSTGDTWEFTTYPSNVNIEVNDFTVPVITSDSPFLDITSNILGASIEIDTSHCS